MGLQGPCRLTRTEDLPEKRSARSWIAVSFATRTRAPVASSPSTLVRRLQSSRP